ncbi:hypothetical protein D030_0295B, partial [Vibrio parahaemolyticus AQ3810]
RCWLALNRILA